jgi:hypothetical protein
MPVVVCGARKAAPRFLGGVVVKGSLIRFVRVLLPAFGVAVIGTATAGSTGLAYGNADHPLAQLSVSANCDNPSFPFCAPPPAGVGTGGIWFWIEIDGDGTGDMTGAFCGHTVGGGGGAGAASIKGPVTWTYSTREAAPAGTAFFGTFDPNDRYYLVTLTIGEQWLIPTTVNHYQARLATGVQIQINVAP